MVLLTLLRGLLGAAALTMYYIAIELLPLKDAVTLFFSSPVVAALLEVAVMGPAASFGTASALGSVFTVSGAGGHMCRDGGGAARPWLCLTPLS